MKDSGAESNLNCGGLLAQEVSEKKNFSMWPRDCSRDVLVKNVAAFCPCPKNLPEAKVKKYRLIALTKKVSKQPSTDFVLWFILMKNILIKHSKLRKEKYKLYASSIKGAPGSKMELNPMFKEIK